MNDNKKSEDYQPELYTHEVPEPLYFTCESPDLDTIAGRGIIRTRRREKLDALLEKYEVSPQSTSGEVTKRLAEIYQNFGEEIREKTIRLASELDVIKLVFGLMNIDDHVSRVRNKSNKSYRR